MNTPLAPRMTPVPAVFGRRFCRAGACALLALALGGCSAINRIAQIGEPPALTPIENPANSPAYRPVSLPMPEQPTGQHEANSLWRPGARAFFRDQRAKQVGDIVTVAINIKDQAQFNNTTKRNRKNSENASASNILGFETTLQKVLPDAVDPTNLVHGSSDGSSEGSGSVDRSEQLAISVAAIVIQVLPNGNFVIHGRQELRVNNEVRELQVAGIVRPEDISATNSVQFPQVAEARIAYGGRGQITDVQQPRYGQQLYDVIFPF